MRGHAMHSKGEAWGCKATRRNATQDNGKAAHRNALQDNGSAKYGNAAATQGQALLGTAWVKYGMECNMFWKIIDILGACDPTGLFAEIDCLTTGAEAKEIQAGGNAHKNIKKDYPDARFIQLSPDGSRIWFNVPKK